MFLISSLKCLIVKFTCFAFAINHISIPLHCISVSYYVCLKIADIQGVLSLSAPRKISLPSDMNIPGCPPQHQPLFGNLFPGVLYND